MLGCWVWVTTVNLCETTYMRVCVKCVIHEGVFVLVLVNTFNKNIDNPEENISLFILLNKFSALFFY